MSLEFLTRKLFNDGDNFRTHFSRNDRRYLAAPILPDVVAVNHNYCITMRSTFADISKFSCTHANLFRIHESVAQRSIVEEDLIREVNVFRNN